MFQRIFKMFTGCGGCSPSTGRATSAARITYRKHKEDDTSYVLHNQTIADPFAWLESPDSERTKAFVELQNALTQKYLDPEDRDKVRRIFETLQNFPRQHCPSKRGDWYYYFANTGLQNQDVLYRTKNIRTKEDLEVFVDPNTWSEDGTTAISSLNFSPDGSLLALAISYKGSDWKEIHFASTAQPLNEFHPKQVNAADAKASEEEAESAQKVDCAGQTEVLRNVKFGSATWTYHNEGVFYPRYENSGDGTETTRSSNQRIYYHKLGTNQEEDVLVLEFPENADWMIHTQMSECGQYLFAGVTASCDPNNHLYVARMDQVLPTGQTHPLSGNVLLEKGILKPIVNEFFAEFSVVDIDDQGNLLLETTLNCPRKKVVKLNIASLLDNISNGPLIKKTDDSIEGENLLETIIPACEQGGVIQGVSVLDDGKKIAVYYLRDVHAAVELRDLDLSNGTSAILQEIAMPTLGDLSGFFLKKNSKEIMYQFMSFTTPGQTYIFDLETKESTLIAQQKVDGVDPNEFEVVLEKVPSYDGKVQIPLFIVQRKNQNDKDLYGLEDENNNRPPCLLYGYGGFNISLSPFYSTQFMTFLKSFPNSRFAVACMRGGGEYGIEWYKGGVKELKQNVFDDFFACAEHLSHPEHGVTNKNKLICMGGSNGGTLVGACVTQRPDLFGAAICQVPVMDMFKFHQFTIGHAWVSDFGNPDDSNEFEAIKKWSPLHNIVLNNQQKDEVVAVAAAGEVDSSAAAAATTEVTEKEGVKKAQRTDGKQWPALLVLTADHDDRVVPLHSLKFIAQAQNTLCHVPCLIPEANVATECADKAEQTDEQEVAAPIKKDEHTDVQEAPVAAGASVVACEGECGGTISNEVILARIEVAAGHGAGKSTAKRALEAADIYAFIARSLNLNIDSDLLPHE